MITPDLVKKFIKETHRHASYTETVDIADHLSFHIDGYEPEIEHNQINRLIDRMNNPFTEVANPYFHKLIDHRRPRESAKIKAYRRQIWANVTKQTTSKVISSLNKIVRAEDWRIDYSKSEKPKKIPDNEQLEVYAERKYPFFQSIENWAYNFGLEKMLSDPNGLVVVLPQTFEVEANEFLKPFGEYVPSKDVLEFSKHLLIYKSMHTGHFHEKGKTHKTPIFILMDENSIWTSQKINAKGDFNLEERMVTNFGQIPAFKMGGKAIKIIENIPVFESYLNPMLPSLDEASREYSDNQAEVVQHIHSTMWGIAGQDCHTCNGVGRVQKDGKQVACGDCKGEGVMPMSPYKNLTMKRPKLDDDKIPLPPMGFIEKNTDIVKLQDERIGRHFLRALESVNMEFLAKTPLNESGKAKEIDKEELNNFVYKVGFNLVTNVMRPIYWWVAKYRYGELIQNDEEIVSLLPFIPVPEKFNLISVDMIVKRIKDAIDAGLDPSIIDELQVDYINKRFRQQPMLRDKLKTINDLNPLSSSSKEEIEDMEMARLVTKLDAVTALYINSFVERAMHDNEDFLLKDFTEQQKIINKLAEDKVNELKSVPSPIRESPPAIDEPTG